MASSLLTSTFAATETTTGGPAKVIYSAKPACSRFQLAKMRLTISRVNAINDLRRSQPRPQMGIEPIDPHRQFTATSSSR